MNFAEILSLMIFSNEHGYSATLGHKDQDGEWDNAYIPVNFRKGVQVENMTKISVTDSWLTFYRNKKGKPIFYIFINEFEEIKE